MSKLFDLFTKPIETGSGTRGGIFVVVGGYIIYMGVRMLENTKNGLSEMSMTQTVLLAAIMFVAGAAVIVYGAVLFVKGWRRQKEKLAENSVAGKESEEDVQRDPDPGISQE